MTNEPRGGSPDRLRIVTEEWQRQADEARRLPADPPPPDNGGVDTSNFATKTELADMRSSMAELRADLKVGVAEIKTALSEGLNAMKGERANALVAVAEQGKEMHKLDAAHKTWVLATVLSVFGSAIVLAGLIVGRLSTFQAPTPVAPVTTAPVLSAPAAQTAPAASR